MTDELSFELLAQQYGLDSDQPINNFHYADGDVSQYVPYGARFDGDEPTWEPAGLTAPTYALPQRPVDGDNSAALAYHFDFDRAEAAGVVAAPTQFPMPVMAHTYHTPEPSRGYAQLRQYENVELRRASQIANTGHHLQAQNEIYVEPEPGKRIRLVPVTALPALYRPLFTFPCFNAVQSTCFPKVLEAGDNIVLSAPTGSGKTVVFELALLRMLMREAENSRAVYLAPTKALCSERMRDWSARFGSVGCNVTELTGDSVHGLHVARKSRLIITTPEKWDSLTRKWDEQAPILSTIKLVMIDEVHILNESQRGARLEVVVTRIKNRGQPVRFVAVSATVPNLEDVALWIGSNSAFQQLSRTTQEPNEQSAEMFQFGEAYRPCPLQKHVYGYPKAKDEFAFQAYLNHKLLELVETHAAGRPCLIFCATRRSTVQAASTIAGAIKKAEENGARPSLLASGARSSLGQESFDDEDLQTLVSTRVAFHHAGLSVGDRRKIEQAFLADQIGVLCCTTTLATGINLPAYCVIIRGTKQYDGQWVEMSELDLIQMMGRAGRPQFDRSGVAVIMCEDTVQAHYRELVSGSRDIESSLVKDLVEHVNAEVGLRARTTEAEISAWIRQSFMWIRLQKNPTHYLSQDEGIGLDSIEDILQHLCTKTLRALQDATLISCSDVDDATAEIKSTEYGDIMSRFFLRHKTMLALMTIPEGANTRDILEALSQAEEFGDQRIRQGEKSFLQGLRTHAEIRFPPRQIGSVADKVCLLIQAALSAINLTQLAKPAPGEANPFLDVKRIFQHATRIIKAAVDITIYRRDGKACKVALDLARSIAARAWDGSPAMLRQIDQVGDRSIKALATAGITTWQHLANSTPARVEMILNRNPPFGSKVIATAQSVPRISLDVMQRSSTAAPSPSPSAASSRIADSLSSAMATNSGVKVVLDVTVRVENRATCMLKSKTSKMALSVCILTLTSDGDYVDFRRMPIWRFDREKRFTLHVLLRDLRVRVHVYAACDEIAGTMLQANLLPADMANGSHRTRVARGELYGGDDVESGGASESGMRTEQLRLPGQTRDVGENGDPESEDAGALKRCKHKCKDTCRHVCCIRAREAEETGQPRQYRFQSRTFDTEPDNMVEHRAMPFSTPTSSFTLLKHKRKADEVTDVDADEPGDLLSQLDRLTARADRAAGSLVPLRMPKPSGGDFARASSNREDLDVSEELSPFRSHPAAASTSRRAEPAPGPAETRSDQRFAAARDSHASFSAGPPLQSDAMPAPTVERPAQRRFLRLLDTPSWLQSSRPTDQPQ
nr:meiosis specific DNA helicase [Pseudozyma thailandica]